MEHFKLQRIEETSLSEHSCLESSDICLSFGEYASQKGYQHSPMNQLIFNLKKPIQKKEHPDWYYKEQAVEQIARLLMEAPNWHKLKRCTWIPFPPSKRKTHQEYDDRLLKILEKINKLGESLDVREMLTVKNDRQPAHIDGKRFIVNDHINNLVINETFLQPHPKAIIIFDDVITSGASFKAAQIILKKYFPNTPIAGVFIARAIG